MLLHWAAVLLAAASPALFDPARLSEKAPEIFQARFETTEGQFIVKVTRNWAPLGADRFFNLVKHGFYDQTRIFRVRPRFLVQFGIHGDPAVTKVWRNQRLADDPVRESNRRGYVGFASEGPQTRTSQVFVNLADNPQLDERGFAPFGQVVEGMDVIESFYMGYGELAPAGRGPDQERIEEEGEAYLAKEFSNLDTIRKAVIVP